MIFILSEPKLSPWGDIQYCEKISENIYLVETASHGGIMIKTELANKILSSEAKKCGFREKGYLNFEEDAAINVVIRELIDKNLYKIPSNINNKYEYEEAINKSLQQYFPEYWKSREKKDLNITYEKRYIVHQYLIGYPILIDRVNKTLNYYLCNMHGQLHNLKRPEVAKITMKTINGLILRTQKSNYNIDHAKTIDGYVYKYLMTENQQKQCIAKPEILSEKIIETNDFEQCIRKMCEWSYENNFMGSSDKKKIFREKNLQYCENYLKNYKVTSYSSERQSIIENLSDMKKERKSDKMIKEKSCNKVELR